MNINEMTIQEVEARLAEIKNELEQRSGEELAALKKEVADLNARKAELKAVEERMAIAKKITEGSVSANVLESRKAEEKKSTVEERAQALKETGRMSIPTEETRSVLIDLFQQFFLIHSVNKLLLIFFIDKSPGILLCLIEEISSA